MGVVDLDDHRLELAAPVPAQEEAGRVEGVPEHSQVGDQRDLPAGRVHAFPAQVVEDGRADVAGGRIEMILVAEGQKVPTPAADRSQPARHLVELVDVEGDVEDPVLERVGEGPDAPMSDDAFEEVGLHAARSCIGHLERLGRLPAGAAPVLVEAVAKVRSGEPGRAPALRDPAGQPGPRAFGTCTSGAASTDRPGSPRVGLGRPG